MFFLFFTGVNTIAFPSFFTVYSLPLVIISFGTVNVLEFPTRRNFTVIIIYLLASYTYSVYYIEV